MPREPRHCQAVWYRAVPQRSHPADGRRVDVQGAGTAFLLVARGAQEARVGRGGCGRGVAAHRVQRQQVVDVAHVANLKVGARVDAWFECTGRGTYQRCNPQCCLCCCVACPHGPARGPAASTHVD